MPSEPPWNMPTPNMPAYAPPAALHNRGFSQPATFNAAAPPSLGAADQQRTSTFGIIRNIVLVGVLLVLLMGCVGAFGAQSERDLAHPEWFNIFGYLIWMPILLIGTTFVLVDKTWLKRKVPRLQRMKPWHLIVSYCVFLFVMGMMLGIASSLIPK